MAIVKVEKNSYTVESLYQWDLNQVLEVYGISLASVPEVHFTNAAMDKAIVRQANMDASGVVRADVPNSLLQKPYTIKAYICTYTGDTFETQYKIEIPVKARNKPADYTLEDDPEVYSFNALENQVVNALAAVEAARQDYNEAVAMIAGFSAEATALNKRMDEAEADTAATLTAAEAAQTAAGSAEADAAEALAAAANALGVAEGAAKIVTGTYVGTGTYGADNPNSLTFDFAPKMLIITGFINTAGTRFHCFGVDSTSTNSNRFALHTHFYNEEFSDGGLVRSLIVASHNGYGRVTNEGKTIEWYATGDSGFTQLNGEGATYYYMAIG